jgi:hypothetical protein
MSSFQFLRRQGKADYSGSGITGTELGATGVDESGQIRRLHATKFSICDRPIGMCH